MLRRSIETKSRPMPFSQTPAATLSAMNATHYSKATITERFANKGIRKRAMETKTVPSTMPQSRQSSRHSTMAKDKSLLRSHLNNQSQMSDAFGANLVMASI